MVPEFILAKQYLGFHISQKSYENSFTESKKRKSSHDKETCNMFLNTSQIILFQVKITTRFCKEKPIRLNEVKISVPKIVVYLTDQSRPIYKEEHSYPVRACGNAHNL